MRVASDINKTCPFRVDGETQLDHVVAITAKTLQSKNKFPKTQLINQN